MASFVGNRLLQQLPLCSWEKFSSRLEAVALPVGTKIYEPGIEPTHGHFMTSGITSIVTFMQDGSGTEVGLVGCEGLVEGLHLLGPGRVLTNGFVQVGGTALRIRFRELREQFACSSVLRGLVLEGVQGQAMILGQTAACNRLHGLDQRMARWLLMVRDRIGMDRFDVTQEFLAEMVGVQRSTVSVAAGLLQDKGLIEYRRGHLEILDGAGLSAAACECYPIVRDSMRNLYGGVS